MLALFSKSWKPTRSASVHIPSQLFPQFRPCSLGHVAYLPSKYYSHSAGQKPDSATLHKFKRVLALRQEFERCDGVDMLHNQNRYARKLVHQGFSPKNVVPTLWQAVWKAAKVYSEYHEMVSEMCKTEHRKKQKEKEIELESKMGPDTPPWLKNLLCGHPDHSLLYSELVPIVSHFESLLEVDAVQQRPSLNGQEREAVKDVLKEHLDRHRRNSRLDTALFLLFASLCVGVYYWLDDWVERHSRGRERDFKELHAWDDNVE